MSIHMRKKELAIVGRCMRDVYQGPMRPKPHSEYVVLGVSTPHAGFRAML